VTNYRAGMTPDGSAWQVEQSPNGLHPEVIATLPTAKAARAFIDARTGELSPLRSAHPIEPETTAGAGDSGAGAQSGAETLPGIGPVLPRTPVLHSPEPRLGRVRAGRSRREVGTTVERR
jgi:hypothetical protein